MNPSDPFCYCSLCSAKLDRVTGERWTKDCNHAVSLACGESKCRHCGENITPDLQEMARECLNQIEQIEDAHDFENPCSIAEAILLKISRAYEAGFKAGKESNGK